MDLAKKHPLWRKPKHHLDADASSDHVHWIELFYDLAHVVAIFVLGNFLSQHLDFSGFLVFAALFTVIWFAWFDLSLFNSMYVSTDVQHRYIMAAQIITIMIMSSAIVHIDGAGWGYFAIGYAINRAIMSWLYFRAKTLDEVESRLPSRISLNFALAAIIFIASALLPKPYSYIAFATGMAVQALLYIAPKVGVLYNERFLPRFGHMAERFALLLLIVAGEGFFKLVITLAEKGIDNVVGDIFVNYAFGGLSIFLLCWIYFDFAGNGKPRDTQPKTLIKWTISHLVLMLSCVAIGVALSAEVKVSFMEQYPMKYATLGCLGLATYLYCLLKIQEVIELRTAHRFATAKVRYIGIGLAFFTLLIVGFVPSFIGNFFWGLALFSQILIPVRTAFKTLTEEMKQESAE
ncbi:low temperature requirement protein A [Vibrio sp. RE86]|uniref:low temperature requirement protein A n=1 Tax=Vibrio sp. RE86 TaxID=2607605 RepID=UPI001493C7BF|nr:low temperature requirement protein A [Vibrio sp. RE86]NOH78246.1 low temperature requirement protein A [Vibrio sp. RE86]